MNHLGILVVLNVKAKVGTCETMKEVLETSIDHLFVVGDNLETDEVLEIYHKHK